MTGPEALLALFFAAVGVLAVCVCIRSAIGLWRQHKRDRALLKLLAEWAERGPQ